MQNLTVFYNSYLKSDDIFDFLDNVNEIKALQGGNHFDTLDTVGLYHDFSSEDELTMSRVSFKGEDCKDSQINTMSTMARKSKDSEVDFEEITYLFEERAGICEYDSNFNRTKSEQRAFLDIKKDFIDKYNLKEGSNELNHLMANFKKNLNLTIQ